MNIEYLRFGDYVVVADQNRELIERKFTNNIDEILRQENKIEIINNIIKKNKEELRTYNNIVDRNKTIRNNDVLLSILISAMLLLCAISSFTFGTVCTTIGLLASIVVSIARKTNIKDYKKKIKGLKYSLTISEEKLSEELNKLKKLQYEVSLTNREIPHIEIIEINDKEEISKIERNIQLAYLYKTRETIIKSKIKEQNIDTYLKTIKINNQKLNEEDKEIILNHASEKKKVLKKYDIIIN